MNATGTTGATTRRIPFFTPARLRAFLWQAAVFAVLCVAVFLLAMNVSDNMAQTGLQFGFDFLDKPAGFRIGESLIAYAPSDNYGRALLVGVLNTLQVALIGTIGATVAGVFLGILRLSQNPLLARLSAGYVETVRNIPLLLQLVLWHALILRLPPVRNALEPLPGVYLSQRGLQMPTVSLVDGFFPVLLAFLGAIGMAVIYARLARIWRERDGRARSVWLVNLAILIALPTIAFWLFGARLQVSTPELRGFNFAGGATLTPEYVALLFGIIIYTSAFIAEIVRSGIQFVSTGQWEAARSLGLRDGRILRLVVLPQALRVIIPPLTNQYLNLTKNSSLAVVIGYPELASITNTVLNQTGHAIEVLLIFMSVYLALSLATSIGMNIFNAHVALKARA